MHVTRTSSLTIENLSMNFALPNGDGVEALQNLSFHIQEGELVSVLGPSGCGKTTLLNIIAGFLSPTGGQVLMGKEPILGPDPRRGMVFQKGALFEWMNVQKNIGFGPAMKKTPTEEIHKIVEELLEVVGLQGMGPKAIYELSGGMQQRVALARCLANDPDVILMDEPLGALDALTREKMQELVLNIWTETKKTILLITHSVEEALLLGERLFVMAPRPGRIHSEYRLPFAELAQKRDIRSIKRDPGFVKKRDEILSIIWEMEEEIMGGSV